MHTLKDAPVAEKDPDIKIDINEKIDLSEGLENGFDAIGKVFGGLVGAIKDAVGPELMKTLAVASWLGKLSECLENIAVGLTADGTVPAEPTGQLVFYAEQFDTMLDGSKLESQKAAFREHLQNCQQAVANASDDPSAAATKLSHAAGYFKAAAASCVPVGGKPAGDGEANG